MPIAPPARPVPALRYQTTPEEGRLIIEIATRASRLLSYYRFEDAVSDLTVAHCNGCRFKLAELLSASAADFTREAVGIRTSLNRRTGAIDRSRFAPLFEENSSCR